MEHPAWLEAFETSIPFIPFEIEILKLRVKELKQNGTAGLFKKGPCLYLGRFSKAPHTLSV